MSRILSIDTETTGLSAGVDEVFEIAVVDCTNGEEWVFRVQPSDYAVTQMSEMAAQVNRYHERTSDPDWRWDDPDDVLEVLYDLLHGAHWAGMVPQFDTEFIRVFFNQHGWVEPRWHYHLIEIESVALGWAIGSGLIRHNEVHLPVKSDWLSRVCMVQPPTGDDRHTALADARWGRDLLRQVAGDINAEPFL